MIHSNELKGLRVLNTRPLEQGQHLSRAIHEAGGISIDFPSIAIEPTPIDWVNILPNLINVQYAIFISANAVRFFYETLKQCQLKWPAVIKTIAIGQASAAQLANYNVPVNYIPSVADSEHLLQIGALQDVKHQTFLLVKGVGGRTTIGDTLLQRGADVVTLDVYRRTLPRVRPEITYSLWHDNSVDIILFTSQQAIQNLFTLLGKDAHTWLCNTPCLVISGRLAEEASHLGMQQIIICNYDTVLATLEQYNKGLTHDKQQ